MSRSLEADLPALGRPTEVLRVAVAGQSPPGADGSERFAHRHATVLAEPRQQSLADRTAVYRRIEAVGLRHPHPDIPADRADRRERMQSSEERSVWQKCGSTCRSRG